MEENDRLFRLYLAVRSAQVEWMNRHSMHFEHYVTVVVAILSVSLGGAYALIARGTSSGVAWHVVALMLLVNGGLSIAASKACDRAYQRFLEAVTIAAKLEHFFRLDGARPRRADRETGESAIC